MYLMSVAGLVQSSKQMEHPTYSNMVRQEGRVKGGIG
jgi:hypothetical protein